LPFAKPWQALPLNADARYGKGRVLLFANSPVWRGVTIGNYALVLNAITRFDKP